MGVNIWLVIAVAAALVLIAGVVLGTGRPRHAEEELGQAARLPVPAATPGSTDPSSLRSLLLSAQSQRATGTFRITSGGRSCLLYFLFGHLFHVVSGSLTGEAALHDCLMWSDVQYTFDSKATLPTEETIERPIDQILAA